MIEELVELLVGVVDAELLEGVDGKVLKAEDVEDTKEAWRVLAGVGAGVDVIDKPSERPRVKRLGHRVSVLSSLHKHFPIIQHVSHLLILFWSHYISHHFNKIWWVQSTIVILNVTDQGICH